MCTIVQYVIPEQVFYCESIVALVTSSTTVCDSLSTNRKLGYLAMGTESEDDNTWVWGLSGICFTILCIMGMGVFSVAYYGRGNTI